MLDKDKLLKEFEKEFEIYKKELGFEASFDELEEEFHLKDYVLQIGFVGVDIGAQIRSRIIEYFRDWLSYLNNLLIPNPGFMGSQTEAKLFNSEEDKKRIWSLIQLGMKMSSYHSYAGLSKGEEAQKNFIDESLKVWRNKFRPGISEIMKRVYEGWSKD